ncbi:MAG TPA: DNA polymerase I [Firmicutes bacterium]|nr:DNA polymerase I [Bacillota bacterium]
MKRLTIIDGNSLLFRAYYASAYSGPSIMRTKDGIPTNAIYIFSNMIVRVLSEITEGDGVMVAFDTGKKTFRHDQLESYKAQRKKAPDELIQQMSIARALLKALGIYTIELDGFEADDIAGSAANTAHKQGIEAILYTSDRDFLQLVNHTIKVHLIKKGMSDVRVMTADRVKEEFGITPSQIPDYKGLCGDASDNLPGIPGIGDKTAVKLLHEYGTFEAVMEAANAIGGKIGTSILEHREIGTLSKKLAIIDTEMTLPFSLDDTTYQGYDFEEITSFCARYELKTLIKNLPLKWKIEATGQLIKVNQVTSLKDFAASFSIGLHFDYQIGNYHREPLLGIGVSNGKATVYIALEDAKKDDDFKKLMSDTTITKYVFDVKALIVLAHKNGFVLKGPFIDILLASYTLDTSTSNAAEATLSLYGASFSKSDNGALFSLANPDICGQIAYHLRKTWPKIKADLVEKGALSILLDIEIPLALVLAKMELEGVPIDAKKLAAIGQGFEAKLQETITNIYTLAGYEFNINSPKQVATILFEELGLPKNRKGSTSADVLKYLATQHPLPSLLLEHRKYAKLMSTYIEPLKNHLFPDGKLHAIFNQALTTTGRLSSIDPNLQNIAVRDEESRTIRQAFYYPDKNFKMVSFDYSQIELRILAHLSKCQPLIDVFNSDKDIHTATAKALFAHEGEVTSLMRRQAKAVNFGIIYGISDWGLSEQLEIPAADAKKIIQTFYATYPQVRDYMNQLVQDVQNNGFVTTLTGRRRYLREIHDANYQTREFAKRAAMNAPIQGTAADLIKIAMIKIDAQLSQADLNSKLIMQIHDELIFKVPNDELDKLQALVIETMEHAMPLDVKLKVSATVGASWYLLKD